jgi:tetratricopeptide (TPR) repeat protein
MIQFSDLQDFLQRYISESSYFVGERIPAKKVGNARTHYGIPNEDDLFALIDGTVFGSAKEGLAVTTSGLYWRNFSSKQPSSLLWNQFLALGIRKEGKSKIFFGENIGLEIISSFSKERLLPFFEELQTEIEALVGDDVYLQNDEKNEIASPLEEILRNEEVAPALEEISYRDEPYFEAAAATSVRITIANLLRDFTKETKEEPNSTLPKMFDVYRKQLIHQYDDDKKIYKGKSFHSYLEDSAKELKQGSVFTGNIPEKKVANAIETYAHSVDAGQIVALYDYTIFGSAKEGFILTYTGLFTGNKKSFGSIDFTKIDSIYHQSGNTFTVTTDGKTETVELQYVGSTALIAMVKGIIQYREMEYRISLLDQEAKKRKGHINISKLLEKLDYCLSIGKYQDTLETIEEVLNIDSRQPEVLKAAAKGLLTIGEDYYSKGYYDLALNAFEESHSFHSDGQALIGLGLVYIERNNYSSAVESFNAALKLQPDNGTLYGFIGYCYFKMKKENQALEAFSNALTFNKDSFELYLYRAESFIMKNQLHEAIEDLTVVLELNKQNTLARKLRGDCFYKLENLEKALEDYLLVRDSSNKEAITRKISTIRVKLQQWEEAIYELTTVLQFEDNNAETYLNRAFAYKETKQHELAIADFTQALFLDGSRNHIYFLRGICHEILANFQEAKADFEAAIRQGVHKEEAEKHLADVTDEIAKMLERQAKEQQEKQQKLFEALDKSDIATVRSLMKGVNQDDMGLTILMHAIIRGKTDVAKAIIPVSNVGVKDFNGYTAFDIAVIKDNRTMAYLLFEEMYEKALINTVISKGNSIGLTLLQKSKSALTSQLYKEKDPVQKELIRIQIAETEEKIRYAEEGKRRIAREEQEGKERQRENMIAAAEKSFKNDIRKLIEVIHTKAESEVVNNFKRQLEKEEKAYQEKLAQLELDMTQLEKQYAGRMESIKSLYYRNLAREKGEFETTAQYSARLAAQDEKKKELERLLLNPELSGDSQLIIEIKNRLEAEAMVFAQEKEEKIARNEQQQKILTEEYQVTKQNLQQQLEDEMEKSSIALASLKAANENRFRALQAYVSPVLSTLTIGRYDADKQLFPIEMGEKMKQIFVPIERAQQFKENFNTHIAYVEGEFTLKNEQPLYTWSIIIQTEEGEKYIFDSGQTA